VARRGKLDAAGTAGILRSLICLTFLLIGSGLLAAAQPSSKVDPAETAKQLAEKEKWQEVIGLAESTPVRSPELDYYYGTALARSGKWIQAHDAFRAGERLRPHDERFPVELAGVDFEQKRYPEAARHLRHALHLDPNDSYANDFLGTVYYLEGNLEAALKYWNRLNKPKISHFRMDPQPRVDPALLDRAFLFPPVGSLERPAFIGSETRLRGLDIFSSFNFGLQARENGQFDLVFHNHEQDGFGANKWEALLRAFRGMPAQTVFLEYYNFHQRAINFASMYRWDAQKRRVLANVSAPLNRDAKRRFAAGLDLRGENWEIRSSSRGAVPVLGSFNMRREALRAEVTTFQSARWNWTAGAELSHRDFRDPFFGSALTPELLSRGYQVKQDTEAQVMLWRSPERRLTLDSGIVSEAGRTWSSPTHSFEKLQGSLHWHWFPKAEGDDYESEYEFRGGKTWGSVPFDELFILGGIGDNNLNMRGHVTTRDGRKGSGPLGRNYLLSNFEVDKNVFHDSFATVKLGPFLDTGRITDPSPGLGSHRWLWDTGGQIKVKAFGYGFALIYGKDLRTGNNTIFVTMLDH
jgi:tetratricopeptide (TPR) repeat protein